MNNRELADNVVEILGGVKRDDLYAFKGVRAYAIAGLAFMTEGKIVIDWRVAGELMEICQPFFDEIWDEQSLRNADELCREVIQGCVLGFIHRSEKL